MNNRSPLPMYAETLVIAELQTFAQVLATIAGTQAPAIVAVAATITTACLLYTSPSPRD